MNNNTYTAKETSFWKFIQENEIEIPIIQRDYAQGRLGKESLRKNFLSDLKKALDNEKPYKDKAMKMDFVYGSVDHEKMNPLDGQQRLTTLWLLHWYIALRAKTLNDEVCQVLKNFTYETRISSREFCHNLCRPAYFSRFDGNDIVGFITKQTWFYSAWKQDPTIQSMLRMLGGTKVTNKKGEDIVDGIEKLFVCPQNCEIHEGEKCIIYRKFNEYWYKLTGDNCPIVFYHLPLKDFGLSDDLYIKMNARGKQLTSFENFKADLVDFITGQSDSELLDDDAKKSWKSLLDERDGIPIKMDTIWTDIFWNNKPQKQKIDEIYFAFLNRFFWDKLFMYKNGDKYVLDIGKGDETSTQVNHNRSYEYLNNSNAGKNVYDTTISYKELDVYKFFSDKSDKTIPYDVFEDLQIVLNRYAEIPACSWDDSFRFIPAYKEDDNGESIEITDKSGEKILKVTYLNQVQRVVFHAVCKYFKDGIVDEKSLKQWMRVVWNLVSGEDSNGRPEIRSTSAMRSAMEFIDSLNPHKVYESLVEKIVSGNSSFDKRCKEEIAKAKQILDEDGKLRQYEGIHKKEDGTTYQTWEDIITKAEEHAFFKGAIRFLFTDANGEINWDDFDTKWKNAQMYFDEKGVTEEYQKSAKLLRALLSRIDISERWFGNYKEFWREILLNKKHPLVIHELLMGVLDVNNECDYWIKNDDLLQELLAKYGKWHILDWNGYSVLTCYSTRRTYQTFPDKIVVLNYRRNNLLQEQCVSIETDCKIGNTNYLYGWNVNFKYNNNCFQWWGSPNDKELDVYLMKENWEYCEKKMHTSDKKTDEDRYFCFRVIENISTEDFLKKLDCLIQQACAEKAGEDCFKNCPNEIKNHLS